MKQKPTRRRFLHGTVAAAGGAMPLNGKSAHAHRDDRLPEPERSGIEHIVVVMRVPTIVASPWTHSDAHPRIHSAVFGHTSILKLIEWRFGLPNLTARDAVDSNITTWCTRSTSAASTRASPVFPFRSRRS